MAADHQSPCATSLVRQREPVMRRAPILTLTTERPAGSVGLVVLRPDSPPSLSPALAHALVRLIANTGTGSLDSRHDGGLSSKVS